MNVITNNFPDMEMWNLEPGSNRGPFLVVQGGYAPGDETKKDKLFVLRHDGRWVASIYYLASDNPYLLDEAVFESSADVLALLGRLGSKPVVMNAPVSEEAIKAWQERTTGSDPMQNFRRWAEGYKKRQLSGTN